MLEDRNDDGDDDDDNYGEAMVEGKFVWPRNAIAISNWQHLAASALATCKK